MSSATFLRTRQRCTDPGTATPASGLSRLMLAMLITLSAGGVARAAAPEEQSSCQILQPPQHAGYGTFWGIPTQVFPHSAQIDSRFSGCQTLWTVDGDEVVLDHRVFFVNGRPVRLKGRETDVDLSRCKPGDAPSEDGDPCGLLSALPYKSYPKRCLQFRDAPADSRGFFIDPACQ